MADEIQTRALAQGVRARQEAATAMEPHNARLAQWQPRVAHLKALIESPRGATSTRMALVQEAEVLQGELALEHGAYLATVSRLTPTAALDSRVADTRRALQSLSAAIGNIHGMGAAPVDRSNAPAQDGGKSSGHGRYPSTHKPRPAGTDKSSGHGRPSTPSKPKTKSQP